MEKIGIKTTKWNLVRSEMEQQKEIDIKEIGSKYQDVALRECEQQREYRMYTNG